MPFQGRFQSFRRLFQGRSWYERATRNARNNRYGMVKMLVCGISIMVSLGETAMYAPIKDQGIAYLISAALFLAFDPLGCLNRFFAPQSQIILAFDCIVAVTAILRSAGSCVMVCGLILSGSLTMVYLLNTSWLGSYNWLMTESVQTALRADLDNRAVRNWQANGRRQIHTLLLNLGFDNGDFALDNVYRPVYVCGYLNGYEKTVKQKSRLEAAVVQADESKRELKECRKKLGDALKMVKEYEAEAAQALQNFQEAADAARYWEQMYVAETKRSARLEQANEELVASLPDPAAVVQEGIRMEAVREKTLEELVLECLANGMSYAQAGKAAGCSKSKAYRIGQQYGELQAQPDKVIMLVPDQSDSADSGDSNYAEEFQVTMNKAR